jgi:hypothetical protein
MNYSLGNMLGGAGAINPDKLSLDLQFATDKTLTARKGPTPTFTRASTARFVGSDGLIQSAAINTPRFDHDPVTLACKGLLIEESRTNLFLRSDDFNTSEWNAAGLRNLTVSSNNTISPSGVTDADKLTVGATTTSYRIVQNTPTVTSGTSYTISSFFKADQVTRVSIYAGNPTTLPLSAIFDLTGNGSVVQTLSGTASIQKYSNGWYRCVITGTAGATSSTSISIAPVSGTSLTYVGNSIDSFYAWGVQLEAGSFPTSYIPTTTASVVRSADLCSITGSAFTGMYNATEGTLLLKADEFRRGSSFAGLLRIADSANTTNNRYSIGSYGNKTGSPSPLEFVVTSGGVVQYSALPTSASSNFKAALAYKLDDMRGALDGTLAAADTPPSSLIIGANTLQISGIGIHIASVSYYKKRLSNAKIQALTV